MIAELMAWLNNQTSNSEDYNPSPMLNPEVKVNIPSIIQPLVKSSPKHLRYAFHGHSKTLVVNISISLIP